MSHKPLHRILSFFLICLFIFSSCAQNRLAVNSYDSSLETELGNTIHRQILQTVPVYSEQTLNGYVQNVGYKIASNAERKELSYRFVILEDDRIYATYAPGGYVYITTGFFRFLQSEIELAGILAYEIALLQYKDPRLSKLKKSFDLLVRTGSYVAPAFGPIGALSILGLALIDAAASNERSLFDRINHADRQALKFLFQSGYDPQGLINPLHRMSDLRSPYRAYLYDYLQSHPIDPIRFNKLNAAFQKLPMENKNFESGRDLYMTKTELVRSSFARK